MSTLTSRDDNDARDAASAELVGVVHVLLLSATRDEYGRVIITLGEGALAHVVDTFNRATCYDPISVDDVGR